MNCYNKDDLIKTYFNIMFCSNKNPKKKWLTFSCPTGRITLNQMIEIIHIFGEKG